MKKILSLILVSVLILLSLSSCKLFGRGDDEERDPAQNGDGVTDDTSGERQNAIWSSAVDTVVIAEEKTGDSELIRFHIFSLTNKTVGFGSPSDSAKPHEVVIGDVGRPISDAAYARLDREFDLMNLETLGNSAYLIYAEGGSLAIAYSDIYARGAAVKYVVNNLTGDAYSFSGVVAKAVKSTLELVDEFRKEELSDEVENLRMYLDDSVVDSLVNFYTLYGSELYLWLANLYDPDVGGFYYSGSARNTEGFLPDLESTGQALNLIDNSGLSALYGGNWEDMLPKEITDKIGAFVLSLQYSDGYFYHPQWGTSISSSRRGRDAGWAADIIRALGLVPKYDTASGSIKGENPVVPSSKGDLTDRLGMSVVVAASAVLPTAASELSSEAAFRTYLDNANISKNSYSIFNNLNARISEIKKADLWDFLLGYLAEKQFDNGLWEPTVSYNSVNGLMKVSTFFNSTPPFPRAEAAVSSVMEIMRREPTEDIEAIVFVYNTWVAAYNILFYCEDTIEEEYRAALASSEYIDKTFKKLAVFKRTDGGFSYNRTTSAHTSQGEHVAVEGTMESDVNATSIAISTLTYMLRVFRLDPPPLFYTYDSIYFIESIAGLGSLIKDPMVIEEPEVITFDNYDPAEGGEAGGVVKYPAQNVQNNIGSEDVDEDGNYRWFTSSIVQNPDPTKNDFVLFAADKVIDKNGNGKFEDNMADREMAVTGSNTEFFITNYPISGNCYVFDADIYFDGTNDMSQPVAQLMFVKRASNDTSMTVNLYAYTRYGKTYLRIGENFAGADGIKDDEIVGGIPTGEWFNLRVEVYKEYDVATNALEVKVKFYVNGEYAGYSDSGYYSTKEEAYLDRTISSVKFAYYRWAESRFYFNNVYAAKANIPFVAESLGASGDDEVSDEKNIYDFADGIPDGDGFLGEFFYKDPISGAPHYTNISDWNTELDNQLGQGTKSPGIRYYSACDPTNLYNKVLKVYTWNTDSSHYKGAIYVEPSRMSEGAKVYEVAFDYYFETIPWLYAQTFFSLEFQSGAGSKLMGITFAAESIPEGNKNQNRIVLKRDDGSLIEGITLTSERWYSLKFEYYYDADDYKNSRIKMYVLDENVNYTCIYDEVMYNKAGYIEQLGLVFSPYKIRGNQYFDNLSFALIEKAYSAESVASLDDVKITGLTSVKVDEDALPENPDAENNRGNGLYYEESVKYDGSADNYLPTVGIEGSNSLGITEVDGDGALQFVHTSDAESRFQLTAGALNGSLVFETDIKFNFLPEGPSRGFQLFGASKVGTNGNIWSGASINLEYSAEKGGYVLKAAGGSIRVSRGEWYNIRLEADGLASGSVVRFYVNGKLVGVTRLGGDISKIVAYELLAPKSSTGGETFIGIVSFDNTYIGEKLHETETPDGTDSNVSGDDMDSGAWDEN